MAMSWIEMILLLFLYVRCTQTKLIFLTPGWEAFASYHTPYPLSNGKFFTLLTSDRTSITSSNSTFALGVFSSDSSATVTLIICLFPFNSSLAIDVWNVGIPMIENDPVLRVSDDKSELQLLDANHNIVWSIPGDVSSLELTESGNLIVYNSSQGIIWQSFDHPTDTFLPGQIMRQGMQFRASNSSYSAADFSTVVESSGLVLYSTSGGLHLPYGAVTVDGTYDYSNAMQKCGNNGTLKMTYDAHMTVDYVVLQGCNKSTKYPFVFQPSFKFRFFRLDSDGNIRHYLWKEGTLIVNMELFGQKSTCELPNICGPYGVCSEEGSEVQCSCPPQKSSSSLAPLFTSDSKAKGCKPTTALSCDARSMRNNTFLTVSNVTYFSNRYFAPLNLTETECVSSCLTTCSCLVAFYEDSANLSARACYHISTHVSSLQKISSDSQKHYLAYIKVQPSSFKVQPSSSKKHSSISHILIIVISIAAAISFLILASMLGFIKWLYSRGEDDFLILMPGVPHKFSHKELEDATSVFQHKLGEGGFGAVFSGKLKDGRNIAVKRLEGARQGQREFEAEVKTLGGIDHINLVRLYGFCIEGVNRLLVYEWMPNGSLDKWLFVDDSEKVLSWASRMAIAMDTAQGLAYLHEGCSQPVLHLDIKPQNILLGEYFKAKVSDLGMAKLINQDVSTMIVNRSSSNLQNISGTTMITQVRGTPGYLAPELLANFTVSKKCDIYSYGIVLFEIISGKRVYGSCDTWFLPSWAFKNIASGNIMQIVDPRMDGNFEHNNAEQVIKLACWCIHENAEQRPSMSQIIQMLQGKTEVPEPTFIEPQPIVNLTRNINSGCTVISDSLDVLAPNEFLVRTASSCNSSLAICETTEMSSFFRRRFSISIMPFVVREPAHQRCINQKNGVMEGLNSSVSGI